MLHRVVDAFLPIPGKDTRGAMVDVAVRLQIEFTSSNQAGELSADSRVSQIVAVKANQDVIGPCGGNE